MRCGPPGHAYAYCVDKAEGGARQEDNLPGLEALLEPSTGLQIPVIIEEALV